MTVRDLDGRAVPGYRVVNAVGITPGARGLPYHRLFSSAEAGFQRKAIRTLTDPVLVS